MPGPEVSTTIERKLAARLVPTHLEVIDDSALHAGHPGARAGGGHYRVTVVSAAFEGLARLARHRLVYAILAEEMQGAIHALALGAYTPAEWTRAPRPSPY
jgi:BolA protein